MRTVLLPLAAFFVDNSATKTSQSSRVSVIRQSLLTEQQKKFPAWTWREVTSPTRPLTVRFSNSALKTVNINYQEEHATGTDEIWNDQPDDRYGNTNPIEPIHL